MALDDLGHLTFDGKKLHAATDSLMGSLGNASQTAPRDFVISLVVDDCTSGKSRVAIEDLGGRGVTFYSPVKNSSGGDNGNDTGADPLPKNDRFVHVMSLDLGFGYKVENLHLSAVLQGDDLGNGIHDGGFGADGALDGLVRHGSVENGKLVGLTNANEHVAFHCGAIEFDELWVHAHRHEVKNRLECNR